MANAVLSGLSTLEQRLPSISEDSPWADEMLEKIQSCQFELRFLEMFFLSLLTLEDTDDADIRHILMLVDRTCVDMLGIFSAFKLLVFFPSEIAKSAIENWMLDLHDKIQTWKRTFEEPCELLLRYSLRGSAFNYVKTVDLLAAILQNLKDLHKLKTCDEILLLNSQIATLEGRVTLLHNFFNRTPGRWTDYKDMRAFEVAVHVFAQYSASLVFLYWVKVVDEDMSTQLNILLLNVLHKYKNCVSVFKDIYIRFLEQMKFGYLLPLDEIIQIFLDLLLENLVDILKDDFLKFQDSLRFLISFLVEPPRDKESMTLTAEIEVLVKEDLYLAKEEVDINGNFSKENTRLSDLTRDVEQGKAKILRAYNRIHNSFSTSRNPYCKALKFLQSNDREMTGRNCVDYVLVDLSSLSENFSLGDDMLERIQSCQFDVRFLKMFFLSLLTLKDSHDAEIKDMLMLIDRTREDMWGISSCERLYFSSSKNWILDVQGRIKTCKQKFEEPCQLLLRYSLRCNTLINNSTVEFLAAILHDLKDLYKFRTGDRILLLNNQIATLESKVILLHNFFNLTPVKWWDFKELRAFNVAVHVFAQHSANLVFLYWVKAVDEDMLTQLNLLLDNVLHKCKTCVTALKVVYIIFLKEMKSRQLDSLLSGQIVQSFLDLLLENMIVHISKNDFQIIQESLFLVTSFLANPPDEHVEDEELTMLTAEMATQLNTEDNELMMLTEEMDLLVKEDLYRVLSVDDMNDDFSEVNACLGDFTRKAEQVYERIRDSFSYDFSKINGLGFFDFLLQNLSFLKERLKRDTDWVKRDTDFIPFAKHLIIQIEEELISLRPYLDDLFEQKKEQKELKDVWLNVIDLASRTEYAINSCSVAGNPIWHNMARLMEVLEKFKDVNRNQKNIEGRKAYDGAILHRSAVALRNCGIVVEAETCKQKFELLSYCSFKCNYFDYKIPLFLDLILKNLTDLYKDISDYDIPIRTLHNMLRLLHILFDPAPPEQWSGLKETRKLKVVVHSFAHYLTILIFFYWVKTIDEGWAAHLRLLLIEVLNKYRSCVPVFKAFYVRILEEMESKQLDYPFLGEITQIFLDLLFESLDEFDKVHFIEFHYSAMFVIAFLTLPLRQYAKENEMMTVIVEIEVFVNEYLDLFLLFDKREGDFSQASSDFTRKVELLKGKILQIENPFRDTFSYDFPKINGLGYFNFLIQNIGFLKTKRNTDETFIPIVKHLIIQIEKELMCLRPYLEDIFEQEKQHNELKDTWLKVIDLAYRTEYAINSCSLLGHQSWYNTARLTEVLYEIKAVHSIMLKKIKGRKTQDDGGIHCTSVAQNSVPKDLWVSGSNAVMVGIENEVSTIIENLTNGSNILTVVAIVGMAGIGKTTIANEVYHDHAVRRHFHVLAYCIVSQVHNPKMILLDILRGIKEKDDNMFDMEEEDLADMLRKCLRGQRYLIIMDDIWDVKAWNEVKRSLPDDQKGSRVIFTSRIHKVSLQTNIDCIVHDLRFLSAEESFELLRKKAFHAECCPPAFLEVGKVIARNCKGLPLAIVLIAGLIANTERNLNWWKKISKTSEHFTQDCMDVLELSYQHLPEHLKPCFLYFGAFAEDTSIPVNKLTLLWIAEGFVQDSNNENLEKRAKEYLCDLIDRSLVIANERSSYGGIKSCRIHDSLHKFCQGKAQVENFFQFMDADEASSSSSSTVRSPYRVCIHMKEKNLGDATKIFPYVHSLLGSSKSGYNPYDITDVSYLRLVQVINFEELEWDNLIRKTVSLPHLRFLAMSFVSEHLSSEFTRKLSCLWDLEILIFTGRRSLKFVLPESIWNMTRLRHVDIGVCSLSSLGVHEGKSYPQLIFLESFSSPSISSTEVLEDLLQRSPSLRKLSFDYDPLGEECGEWDFQFPELSKLESLSVSSVKEPFLRSLVFLSTLKKLTLSNCFIHWRYLPSISKIPCLEVLKLLDYSFTGHVWDMEDTKFPKLKFLKLQKLNVGKWIACPESFPFLEVLIVNKCSELNAIPPCFEEMTTLKRIEVFQSDGVATSVVDIQDVQKDYGNEELQVVVSLPAPSKVSDDDSCDENDDELEEEIELASLCA